MVGSAVMVGERLLEKEHEEWHHPVEPTFLEMEVASLVELEVDQKLSCSAIGKVLIPI